MRHAHQYTTTNLSQHTHTHCPPSFTTPFLHLKHMIVNHRALSHNLVHLIPTVKANFFLRIPRNVIPTQKGPRLRKPISTPTLTFTLTPTITHPQTPAKSPHNPLHTFIKKHIHTTHILHTTFLQGTRNIQIHNTHAILTQLLPSNIKLIRRRHCFFNAPSYSSTTPDTHIMLYVNIVHLLYVTVPTFLRYFFPLCGTRPIVLLCTGIG